MSPEISLALVEQEHHEASKFGEQFSWELSAIDAGSQLFNVRLDSPVDQEPYWLEFRFGDYPDKPYLIDLFYPPTGERATPRCYPKGPDSFFHPNALICHPCSRRAYREMAGPHQDWNLADWRRMAGGMDRLVGILNGIYFRISNVEYYNGRMASAPGR